MSEIINLHLADDIIDFTAERLLKLGADAALISGGRRPFLFIRKALAGKIKKASFAQECFTRDEFIDKLIFNNSRLSKISQTEGAYILFEIIKEKFPDILKGRRTFAEFFKWAVEILSFIDNSLLEDVSGSALKNIERNADIGYEVPRNINDLLKNIFNLRESFLYALGKKNLTMRGLSYLLAGKMSAQELCCGFDKIILLAPFYMHKTELVIFKKIYDEGKLTVILQGDPRKYAALKEIYDFFGENLPQINKTSESKSVANIGIYKASDDQSQSALARNIIALKHKDDFEQTVIVAPTEQILQTVIAEVSALGCDFNVSAGYPAGKTALFVLIRDIINARISMQNGKYFVKDLLRVLTNPLIKNMRFFTDSSAARIAVHKIEEAFSPGCAGVSALSGRSFVKLEEISKDAFVNEEIIKLAGYKLSAEKLRAVFEEMFKFLFLDWQNIVSFNALAVRIEEFVLQIFKYSIIRTYPLNVAAAQTLNDISKDLKAASAAAAGNQKFDTLDIFKIFNDLISGKKIALKGSPLKGLQVLGFLEARNLSFKNVFILGMSDSALPSVSKTSPLIPLEIMRFLGIKMPSREYEIQQYHFERLIAQAQNVYLVYPGNDEEPRSRFIEKIIWDKQLSCKNINAAPISEFNVASQKFVFDQRKKYEKTPDIKKFLKEKTHSYSAIDKYLQCELKFYFHYVCGLDDEETEISKDAGAREIGVFVHDFLKEAFCAGLKYSLINSEAFKLKFDALFEDIFKKSVFVNRQDSYFVKKVLQYRLEKFLYEERQRDFGVVCECEKEFRAKISCADKTEFNLTAKIDRIDEKDGSYTIIDYKTSSQDCVIKPRIFDLSRKDFDRKYLQSAVSSLQLPMYEYVFGQQTGFPVGSCFLYDLKRAAPVYFYEENKHKKNGSQQEYLSRCIQMLSWALDDICAGTHFKFNPCDDTKQCQTCKFRHICS